MNWKRSDFLSGVLGVLVWGGVASAFAQEAPIAEAHELKLGAVAPEFELPSHLGEKVALKDLLKEGPVAVVFHRSADW